ncbi:MAG: CBS domain-containing protein [Xanthomonadaceae bacterium]|nr:CBS domain-containing protein [Xanthomonadaceae bacterium]
MIQPPSADAAQARVALVLDVLQGRATLEAVAARAGLAPAVLGGWVEAGRQGLERAVRAQPDGESRPPRGDLRDLIPRPFAAQNMVLVAPHEPLSLAWERMQAGDVSQLPVMDGERIVGMLDESDVLLHVYGDEARFADPAAAAMVARLDKVNVQAPIEALLPVFDRGHVAIVMDGEQFLGLITRIDLLDYLRRRAR